MASATTTIRVSTDTRDRINALSAREGRPAGEIVAELVSAADDERLLAEAIGAFEKLANDSRALAAYRAESGEVAAGFDAPAPDW